MPLNEGCRNAPCACAVIESGVTDGDAHITDLFVERIELAADILNRRIVTAKR
jgi:hypothetical protein